MDGQDNEIYIRGQIILKIGLVRVSTTLFAIIIKSKGNIGKIKKNLLNNFFDLNRIKRQNKTQNLRIKMASDQFGYLEKCL